MWAPSFMIFIHNTNHHFPPPPPPPPQPIEVIPSISLSPKVHYKTQSSRYDTHVTGLLTDKIIEKYQRKNRPVKNTPRKPLSKKKFEDPLKKLLRSLLK